MSYINTKDGTEYREGVGRITELNEPFVVVMWSRKGRNWVIPQDIGAKHPVIDTWSPRNPLSNCAAFPVEYEGVRYPSLEHAYQTQRFLQTFDNPTEVVEAIAQAKDGETAAAVAQVYIDSLNKRERRQMKEVWECHKLRIMFELIIAKVKQNPEVYAALVASKDYPIVEITPNAMAGAEHNEWGVNDPSASEEVAGRNFVGRILMRVRYNLNQSSQASKIAK